MNSDRPSTQAVEVSRQHEATRALQVAEGGGSDGLRVLVAYESKYGSTGEVADRIGQTLGEAGSHVDVRHVRDIETVDGYDLVVVGGAIQYDNWMRGAADFVRAHRRQLTVTPVAFFFTCLALSKPSESATRSADSYERKIRAIVPEIEPLDVGRFAGTLDYSPMNPVVRIVARILLTLRGAHAGDHRNWGEIVTWTTTLTPLIEAAHVDVARTRERRPSS